MKRGQALRLTVIAGGPDGIAKATGLPLAGDGVHAGTNYVATIIGRSIRPNHTAPKRSRHIAAVVSRG